ncbi:MAG: hypothetical protein HY582_02425 [Candidatus Omnitrophica bacterium]|nr:hypothetical protein [Candidatus Omnitrophota bacterium]
MIRDAKKKKQTGGILSTLLFIVVFLVAIVFGWYWYQENPEVIQGWLGHHPSEDRGYLTYEEYLSKKKREKTLESWKSWVEKTFGQVHK